MTGIKIPVSAEFDAGDVQKAVAQISEQMTKLGQVVAAANKIKFNPVTPGAVAELKQMQNQFNELKRVSGSLRERLKATGQSDTSFGDIDWNRMYHDKAMAQRKMSQAYNHVTAGTRYALPLGTPGLNQGGRGAPDHPPQHQGGGGGGGFQSMAGQVAGAGLRAAGPVGGVVANAAGAGMSGGLGAGLFGLLGGLAALGIGKGVGAIKNKVDAAGQEGIGYDTLKRTLGDVNVGFNALRASLRAASNNIDVTFEESQKLGSEFAKISGISKITPKELGDEVSVGGGFGRSFGMDPSESNQFFAQMRAFKVTESTGDSKRLAVMIGEAVGKSGSFSKADEVLQAISSFTASQSRSGLAGANAVGYAGTFSGLLGSGVPGLDPQGAAALLSRVNSSIASGGAAGEAGQNYLFSALGRKNGLDPIQTAMLQQQGAFGTGRMAFGKGSLYSQFSKKFGGGVSGAAASSDETNLSAILAKTQKDYASNPSLMLNATARLLGVNENQAMALHTIAPHKLNSMTGRMGRLGLDMNGLSSTGISALSNIESGGKETLAAQVDALRQHKKSLTNDERQRLDGALAGGDPEKLKDILTELTYSREQEQTEGSKTRESIQQVDKTFQEYATKLVPLANDMRNALVFMAGGGKMGAGGINAAMKKIDQDEITNAGAAQESEINSRYGNQIAAVRGRAETLKAKLDSRAATQAQRTANMTPDQIEADNAEIRSMEEELKNVRKNAPGMIQDLEKKRADELGKVRSETSGKLNTLNASYGPPPGAATSPNVNADLMAELAKTDKQLGMAPGTSAAQLNKESRFNPSAFNRKSGAMGMAQVMPKTLSALEKRMGRKLDPYNAQDAILIHREVMRENKARFKTDAGALAAYNSGWDPSKWGNSETTDYLATIDGTRGRFATPMPAGAPARAGGNEPQKIHFENTVTLNYPNGSRAAEPVTVKKTVSAPRASGV
jgi:soluble lytic murein transglycosylase-like protein